MVSAETPPSQEQDTEELNVDQAVDIAYQFAHSVFAVIIIFFYSYDYLLYISTLWRKMSNLWSIMFYIQGPDQFDTGVRPTPSAEPQEEIQVIFYVFQCMIIYDLLFLSIIVFVLTIVWFCSVCHGLLDRVMLVTRIQWL